MAVLKFSSNFMQLETSFMELIIDTKNSLGSVFYQCIYGFIAV